MSEVMNKWGAIAEAWDAAINTLPVHFRPSDPHRWLTCPASSPLAQHDEHVRRYRFHLQYHDQIQARLRRELPVIHAAQAKRARKNEKRLKGRGL